MAFWGIEVKASKPFIHSPDQASGRLRISQATLGFGSANEKSVVQCNVGKKSPVLLCSLVPDKAESCHLELEFEEAEEVTFSVIGPRSVFLTGYFVANVRGRAGLDDESESYGEDVGDSETSDFCDDEDDYDNDDSFIDDGDLDVFPSPPLSNGKARKGKTESKKPDSTNGGLRRLRKTYEMSESEDDGLTAENKSVWDIVDSEEDLTPTVREDSKRKVHQFAEGNTDKKHSEERKVKRKKRKTNEANATLVGMEGDVKLGRDGAKFVMQSGETKVDERTKADSDGLVVEDVEIGEQNGKVASSGKKVTIHYTGKLKKGGKIFHSSTGKKPLKFRLGEGYALDGRVYLDCGIEGMRVGGKRRLLIPPALGYGSEGTADVPPNSWLILDIELLRVRR